LYRERQADSSVSYCGRQTPDARQEQQDYLDLMDRALVEQALSEAEKSVARGDEVDLGKLGFWKAVNAVKQQPGLVAEFGDRIGRTDREVFERRALLSIPVGVGTALMIIGTLAGLFLIGWAYQLASFGQALTLLVGTAILLVTTHGLTHLAVGTAQGMRFTHWFIASFQRPQPGVKVDYATYLRVAAEKRAWMHGSAAIVTKLIPFLSLGAGWAMGAPGWTMAILGVIAVGQIITDILWSTKASDWKKFRREMAIADSR
jgi:hypothetical protein